MEANTPKNGPSPERRDQKDRNEVPGYEQASYVSDWRIATVHTARDDKYQTPHRRTIRDATVIFPGEYLG